ncbi:hypothetical protein [Jeotgalibacillus malaysiensis]|uniref:hypothetical protein n=1 Tax=Jeotgalibacillus malaysiensis TaxID=1508404 RepID=UPI00384E1210
MKKYFVFILSLAVLYIGFQIASGWVLTALYTPDPGSINPSAGEAPVFYLSPAIQLMGILFITTLAYMFTQKLVSNA